MQIILHAYNQFWTSTVVIFFVCYLACVHNGVFVLDGQLIQLNCSTKCTCQNRELICEPQSCLIDGPTCVISGDPHYQTFDLRYFDFQGDCEYTVSRPCGSNEFDISVRNEAHNEKVSCPDQVTVRGGGLTILLGRGFGGTVTIDGVLQPNTGDGIIAQNDEARILRTGGHPNIIFPTHGVRVFFDGLYRVEITVSSKWQGQLCGLCGNYNGNPADDNQSPAGVALVDSNALGNSWLVGDPTGCNTPPIRSLCDGTIRTAGITMCSTMQDQFFSACNPAVDPIPFMRNCIIDVCGCNADDRKECYCESLATYAAACAAKGVALPDWRTHYQCRKCQLNTYCCIERKLYF